MAFEVTIDVIEKPPVAVDDEVAEMLTTVHDALTPLPGDRAANVDFADAEGVKGFLKQAKAWADDNGKRFTRVGDIKGKPLRVSFRVVTKRTAEAAEAADPMDAVNAVTPTPAA